MVRQSLFEASVSTQVRKACEGARPYTRNGIWIMKVERTLVRNRVPWADTRVRIIIDATTVRRSAPGRRGDDEGRSAEVQKQRN